MPAAESMKASEPQLAHSVIFTLKDPSAKSREDFVGICDTYLTSHKGAVSYACGTIAEDVKEGSSDREFDVALHVVFENKGALAEYLKSERHDKFVAAIKDKLAKVRVFDSYLPPPKGGLPAYKPDPRGQGGHAGEVSGKGRLCPCQESSFRASFGGCFGPSRARSEMREGPTMRQVLFEIPWLG